MQNKKIIKCIKGFVIDGINDCDESCEMQVGFGKGDCYAECLQCGGDYIKTGQGIVCSSCDNNGVEI